MSESRASKLVKLGYSLAIVLWAASLLLPAAQINGSMLVPGHRAFTIGVDAIRAGILGWLANPFALGAMVAGVVHRLRTAVILAAIACALGASSFLAPAMARADGVPISDVEFKVGFFLWLTAFSLIFAASAGAWMLSRVTSAPAAR
jgi:hypothetical protein